MCDPGFADFYHFFVGAPVATEGGVDFSLPQILLHFL